MQLTLLFLVLICIFSIAAMDNDKVNILDTSEWVTIMITSQDGVIIESDPDSAGDLPFIGNSAEQSYYDSANKAQSCEPKEAITIHTSEKNLTNLIRENYPEKHPIPATVHDVTLLLKRISSAAKK